MAGKDGAVKIKKANFNQMALCAMGLRPWPAPRKS